MSYDLYHHGVLGMHWGVRRFEDKNGRLTSRGKKRYNDNVGTVPEKPAKARRNESDESKESAKQKFHLTDKQKKAIKIGAAVAVTALAAYGTYKLCKGGKLDSLIGRGKQSFGNVKDVQVDSSPFKKLKVSESFEDTVSRVNATGQHQNCYNCVVGAIARLCGYDVTARGDTQNGKGLPFKDVCDVFKLDQDKDVTHMMSPSLTRVKNIIGRKFKEGDTGGIALEWNAAYKKLHGLPSHESAGHTMNWIVKNGKPTFFDTQAKVAGDYWDSFIERNLDSNHEVSIAKFANIYDSLNLETDVNIDLLKKFVQ